MAGSSMPYAKPLMKTRSNQLEDRGHAVPPEGELDDERVGPGDLLLFGADVGAQVAVGVGVVGGFADVEAFCGGVVVVVGVDDRVPLHGVEVGELDLVAVVAQGADAFVLQGAVEGAFFGVGCQHRTFMGAPRGGEGRFWGWVDLLVGGGGGASGRMAKVCEDRAMGVFAEDGRHRVAVLVRHGLLPMELGIVHRIFGQAETADGRRLYEVVTCAPEPGELRTDVDFTVNVRHGPRPSRRRTPSWCRPRSRTTGRMTDV